MAHKPESEFPIRVASAHLLIIVFVYIYIHYIVDQYGDIITEAPVFDLLGEYKCTPAFAGCDDQYIDGWAVSRILAFMLVGFANPHSHYSMLPIAVLIQAYEYAHNNAGRHIINPMLTMVGYSIGSFMCPGYCDDNDDHNKKN
jgi:hypothetical protein